MEARPEVSLNIDGQEVAAAEGATILQAARQAGIRIPTLCHHDALSPWGGCRLCVVEVDGSPKLAASCVMPVRKGMQVVTVSERILAARRTVLEFLFSERTHYCMFCAQSGDCELQALAYEHGLDHMTVPPLGQDFPVDASHGEMVRDHNRCVLCGRCVRACREIAGARVLDFQGRGGHTMIGADLAGPLGDSSCLSCGSCLQVCPTGAIFHRARTHYAVLGKSHDWQNVESLCPRCGLLCPTLSVVRDNNLLKIEALLPAGEPWQAQLCRKGRFEPFKETRLRLLHPMLRADGGGWREAAWEEALGAVVQGLEGVRGRHGGQALLGLVSSDCANEEILAFLNLMQNGWSGGLVDTLDGPHHRTLAQASGGALKEAPWGAVLEADLIVLMGASPWRTHPMMEALVRRALLGNKAKLAVVGPDNHLGPWASLSLPLPAGELPALLGALLSEMDWAGGIHPPTDDLARWGKAAFEDLLRLVAEARHPIFVTGPELTGLGDPTALRHLIKLAQLKRRLAGEALRLIVLKPAGNSAGAWALGAAAAQEPAPGATFQGGLLCLDGENGPWPGLASLEFLAVLTPYVPESPEDPARVLLPKPTWLESEGTYASTEGKAYAMKPRVLAPPPGVPPAAETLSTLAQRLGAHTAGQT